MNNMDTIKRIEKRIKDIKNDIKEYHLPYEDELENKTMTKVNELMNYVENIEFTQDEDLIWLQAKVRAFQEALRIIKGK